MRISDWSSDVCSSDLLATEVGAMAAALTQAGVAEGDRVAAWLPNGIEAVVAMLGASAVGALFSSTSPDFGAAGVLDRFGQSEPTEIGRASWRESVGQYVWISVVAVDLKKKQKAQI